MTAPHSMIESIDYQSDHRRTLPMWPSNRLANWWPSMRYSLIPMSCRAPSTAPITTKCPKWIYLCSLMMYTHPNTVKKKRKSFISKMCFFCCCWCCWSERKTNIHRQTKGQTWIHVRLKWMPKMCSLCKIDAIVLIAKNTEKVPFHLHIKNPIKLHALSNCLLDFVSSSYFTSAFRTFFVLKRHDWCGTCILFAACGTHIDLVEVYKRWRRTEISR